LRWLSVPQLPPGSPGWFEWASGLALFGLAFLCAAAAAKRLLAPGAKDPTASARLLGAALTLLLGLLAIDALWLIIDGRYHPLRWELAALPLPFLIGLAWLGERLPASRRGHPPLAAVAIIAAFGVGYNEGPANTQAMLYGGLLAAMALVSLFLFRAHRAVTPSSRAGSSCIPPNG
jgi:hypothetical protein